jgi:hypothetical protein
MNRLPESHEPPLGLGLTAVALSLVGLFLFFMPILSIPASGFGLAFGLAGLVVAIAKGPSSLRWSVGGTVLGALALGVSIAIAMAPQGYIGSQPPLPTWNPVPDRPYVPPPARPGQGRPDGL